MDTTSNSYSHDSSSKPLLNLQTHSETISPVKYSLSYSSAIGFPWLRARSAGQRVKTQERTTNMLTLHEYSAAQREAQRRNVSRWRAP